MSKHSLKATSLRSVSQLVLLPLLVFATSTQFAVDGESHLLFSSNYLKAYLKLELSTAELLF